MLDDFANVLAETSELFGEVAADFIVHAGLRYITGLILEIRSKSEPASDPFSTSGPRTHRRY